MRPALCSLRYDVLEPTVDKLLSRRTCHGLLDVTVAPGPAENAGDPFWVMADVLRLRQVFTNLVKHTVKFTDGKGVLIGLERVDDQRVTMWCQDSGSGIPLAIRASTHPHPLTTHTHGMALREMLILRDLFKCALVVCFCVATQARYSYRAALQPPLRPRH